MDKVVLRKRGTKVLTVVALVVACLMMLLLGACGGGEAVSEGSETTQTSSSSPEVSQGAAEGEGTALAKEILATFDELVTKVADAAKAKPEPSALTPQLEELYNSYTPVMEELNTRYLALRDADIAQFGECNTYLGSNRGKHVTEKDNTLTEAVKYYNLELGDKAMVSLLSEKPVQLLEIAVTQK